MTPFKKLILTAASLMVLAVAVVGYRLFQEARTNAIHSCVASIHAQLEAKFPDFNAAGVTPASEWVVLSDDAVEILFSQIPNDNLDCDTFVTRRSDGAFIDPWHNQIRTAVRKLGQLEFLVWSGGPDGQSRTSDDIVSVHDQDVPK